MEPAAIAVEGYTPDELLCLLSGPDGNALLFSRGPVVFRAGSAEVLARFARASGRLTVEVAHVDGGGEGVLPLMWHLAAEYARREGIPEVEWIVHAATCAQPNLRLRRLLERKGFRLRVLPGTGPVYHLVSEASPSG